MEDLEMAKSKGRELPPPPEHLSDFSKGLWKKVMTHWFSEGRLIMLEQALISLDRANQAREVIDRDGLVAVTTRTGVSHLHPAAKLERESRQLFMKVWKAIGLHWNSGIDKR
jgi:phage terminase small subunit